MKKNTILLTAVLFTALSTMAQVAINKDGTDPNASAILDVKATDAGFLPPRMTISQRDAISSPADGLVIYNITTECLEFYKGGAWTQLCGGSGTPKAVYTIGTGGSCSNTAVNGIYVIGVPLTGSNTIEIDATVTSTGSYSLTTNTVNGYSFSASGNFTSTGTQTVTLTGSGTPVAAQTDNFTITGNGGSGGTCTFDVTVYATPTVYNSTTGKYWMDRNLGASQQATSSTDAAAYGDLYQWGRATEGHESRTSGTTSTNATTAVPNAGNSWDGLFITEGSSPYDWLTPQDNTLWQGVSGTNNPCPSGFRIPTEAEWEAERVSWASNNAAGAFGSVLKLTVGGYRLRSSGSLTSVGSNGLYWSSTVDGIDAHYLNFSSSSAGMTSYYRAYGFSVRCIKD